MDSKTSDYQTNERKYFRRNRFIMSVSNVMIIKLFYSVVDDNNNNHETITNSRTSKSHRKRRKFIRILVH